MRALPLAVSLVGLLLATGCADGKAEKIAPPTVQVGGAPSQAAQSAGAFSKEGWFGGADGLHARVDVKGVERQATKSVLRFSVTSLDSSAKSDPFEIALIDPVGRTLYKPTGTTSGENLAPGATREMAAEYPPIPASVQKVTALTPGTAGEFTGIPVTSPSSSSAPTASAPASSGPVSSAPPTTAAPSTGPSSSAPSTEAEPFVEAEPFNNRSRPFNRSRPLGATPSPSSSSPSPSASASGAPSGNPVDLYDIVEGEAGNTSSSRSSVTVSLRGDVLFETGSAKLTSRAKSVLDDVAQQIKPKAARALTFEGHADDAKVSGERAQAVVKEMKAELGDGFTYTASGKQGGNGVEITYQLKTTTPGTTSPAAFRKEDGKTVATRTARFGGDKRRLDVKPFYRDGAYIVAVFDIVNEGPGTTPPDASYPNTKYPGGVFGSFSIQVQGKKDVYRAVRVGPGAPGAQSVYVDPGRAAFRTAVDQPVRGFVYLPAPPGETTSVVFDAGPFGRFDKVPVS